MGTAYTCGGPTDQTIVVGAGPATLTGTSVDVQSGGTINVAGNQNAITVGDNANITLETGSKVLSSPSNGASIGPYNSGFDTIEFNNNGKLLVKVGAQVRQNGPSNTAEAVNVEGAGNTIENHGYLFSAGSAAIWFQDLTVGAANSVDNYGTIETGVNGGKFSVIGNNGNGAVNFINRTGAKVIGSIDFAGGNDSMTLYTGSSITGSINGGGGTNSMVLRGTGSDSLQGPVNNFSSLTKEDSGTWTLTGTVDNAGSGGNTPIAVTINNGILAVGDPANPTASVAGSVDIKDGTLAGYGSVTGDVTNSGTIAVASAVSTIPGGPTGSLPLGTLTINGNYAGNNANLVLRTYLGDSNSPTDLLVITGNATGNTVVSIINAGGPGAQTTGDGIKVIQVDGTSTPSAFHLKGAVAIGAWDYNLYHGGIGAGANGQDWYLRSVDPIRGGPVPTASVQTALPYADVLSNYAEATQGTLQQRTGNRIWPNGLPPEIIWCKDPAQSFRCTVTADQAGVYAHGGPVIYGSGAWGRIAGQYSSYNPRSGSAYTQGIGFLQAGYEGIAYEAASGLATLGLYATIGTSTADIDVTPDQVNGTIRKGKITTTGYGIGANATWLGNNGFYADAIGQFTWYQSDLSNKLGVDNQGRSSALSLETGKRFELGNGWAIVPQAQLAWTHVDFNSFTDINGARVSLGNGDSLKGRVGVRVDKLASWKADDGSVRRLQLYGIVNLTYEFLEGTKLDVASVSFTQQNKRLWGEVGLGGTYGWNDKWSVYGEASYATALSSHAGSDNYTVKSTVGLRYRW